MLYGREALFSIFSALSLEDINGFSPSHAAASSAAEGEGCCLQAMDGEECVGVIIGKLDRHRNALRGYIAMLAVARAYRKRRIGTLLVKKAILEMRAQGADEVGEMKKEKVCLKGFSLIFLSFPHPY